MMDFPNSSAMDVTASSGGPITFLPQILTGQPAQIAQHSAGLLAKATQFISMVDQFTKAAQQLQSVWSGQASQSAVQQITSSIQSFQKIIQVVQNAAKLLGVSGTLVQSAQTAYRSVVGSVNPTVASLMSNPWTYSAAVALSTSTSASLRAFIMSVQALLQALGVGQLGAEITTLMGVITQIEQLASGTGATATTATGTAPTATPTITGTLPTIQSISSTPVSAPQTPPPVASAAGQQAISGGITNYTPPALQGFTPTTTPTTTAGLTPSIDPSNSWIAVDPNSTAATAPVAPASVTTTTGDGGTPVTGGEEIAVTSANGVTTTVSVPQGQTADVSVGADGSVRVSR
ncbi:MAG TPA: WXG100 family type VII secretion target [Pseudonocardiaceae bacterium]|jgi:uncharacterized protein YukE|nr:WXG100 family type VII secretion target [Pseudonocardiaceae bacterium]